jgi:hypothetical protein
MFIFYLNLNRLKVKATEYDYKYKSIFNINNAWSNFKNVV